MNEADPVPLSALQHWVYCPRQCGLIHLEQAFADTLAASLRAAAAAATLDELRGVEVRVRQLCAEADL